MKKLWIVPIVLALLGCSGPAGPGEEYRIGRDPTFWPIDFSGKSPNVLAFSDDLVREIAKEEGFRASIMSSSAQLTDHHLSSGQLDGVLSAIPPLPQFRDLYSFSDVYLFIGPVLVVRNESEIDSMEAMKGKTAGVRMGSSTVLLVAKIPEVVIDDYATYPTMIQALVDGRVDGIVIDALSAYAYKRDLFSDQIKIVTPPMTDDGLRLLTKRGDNQDLIDMFNDGLEDLRDSGAYNKLQDKWGLDLTEGPKRKT